MTGLSDKGARRREAILGAAERAFAQSGLHGAGMREIAGAVDMAVAGLLHHFPRKEGLYDAVLGRIATQLEEVIGAALRGRASHRTKLRRLVRRFVDWAEGDPQRCKLLLRELLDNPSRLRRAGRYHLAPAVRSLTAFIEEGQDNGAFARTDPLMFVVHLAGTTSYFIAAAPTLARIEGCAVPSLHRRFRRELLTLIENRVLEE